TSTMLLVAPTGVMKLFSSDVSVAGHHVDLAAPIRSGTAMVLGVLLLVGAISMQRWRRWPRPAGPQPEEAAPERPLGNDGLGLAPPYEDREPDRVARYASDPAPYGTGLWPVDV